MHIDNGPLSGATPRTPRNQTDHRDRRQRNDEMGAEPIVFLALVEHHLKSSDAESQKRDTDVVDANARVAHPAEVRRILDHSITRNNVRMPTGRLM